MRISEADIIQAPSNVTPRNGASEWALTQGTVIVFREGLFFRGRKFAAWKVTHISGGRSRDLAFPCVNNGHFDLMASAANFHNSRKHGAQ